MLPSWKKVLHLLEEQDVVHKNRKTGPSSGQTPDAAAIFPETCPLPVPDLQARFSLPGSVNWDTGLPSAGKGTFEKYN